MGAELEWTNWPGFSDKVMARMEAYPWPGNVRELRNVVERSVYRWEDPERPVDSVQFDPFASPWAPTGARLVTMGEPADVAAEAGSDEPSSEPPMLLQTEDFRASVDTYERALLEEALNANRFNQRATAAAIGLSYDQLRHALKRHKLLDASSR